MDKKYYDGIGTEVIRLMSEGKSRVQVCAALGINKNLLLNWSRDPNKPEFTEAYNIGLCCYEAYHEDLLLKHSKGIIKGSAAAQIYLMKCRFRREDEFGDSWKESTDQKIELKNELKTMTDKEIEETIKCLLAQRLKNSNSSGSPANQE